MKHTKIMNIFPVEAHWLLAIFWRRLKRDQSLRRTSEVADWGFTLWAEWEALCLETKEKPWKALTVIGFLPWAATLNPRRCTNCIPRIWTHPHCPIALDFTDSCGSLVWKCMEAGAPIVVPNHLQHFIWRYMKRHEGNQKLHNRSHAQLAAGNSRPVWTSPSWIGAAHFKACLLLPRLSVAPTLVFVEKLRTCWWP